MLRGRSYPRGEGIYVSPLKRCIETAGLIYPAQSVQIIEELAECDFGDFENKNYRELDGNPEYQKWIDSQGMLPFPGGESQEEFRKRCTKGFQKVVSDCIRKERRSASIVAHGGTIMSILAEYARPVQTFYYWHADNGRGYEIELDEKRWQDSRREVTVLSKITMITTKGRT